MHGTSHLPASSVCLTLSLRVIASASAYPTGRHVCVSTSPPQHAPTQYKHLQCNTVYRHNYHTNTTHTQRRHTPHNTYTDLSQHIQYTYIYTEHTENAQHTSDWTHTAHVTSYIIHTKGSQTHMYTHAREFSFCTVGSRSLICPLASG